MERILLSRNEQQIRLALQRPEKAIYLIDQCVEAYQQQQDLPPLTLELLRRLLNRPDNIQKVWEDNLEPLEVNGRKISPTALADKPDFEPLVQLFFRVRSEIAMIGNSFFTLKGGKAVLSEEYRQQIIDTHSQYVATEEESKVWNLIQKLREATEELLAVSGNSILELNLLRSGREQDLISLYNQAKPRKNLHIPRQSTSRQSAGRQSA